MAREGTYHKLAYSIFSLVAPSIFHFPTFLGDGWTEYGVRRQCVFVHAWRAVPVAARSLATLYHTSRVHSASTHYFLQCPHSLTHSPLPCPAWPLWLLLATPVPRRRLPWPLSSHLFLNLFFFALPRYALFFFGFFVSSLCTSVGLKLGLLGSPRPCLRVHPEMLPPTTFLASGGYSGPAVPHQPCFRPPLGKARDSAGVRVQEEYTR